MKDAKIRFHYGLVFLLLLIVLSFGKLMYTKYTISENVIPTYKMQK